MFRMLSFAVLAAVLTTSCISKKKFLALEEDCGVVRLSEASLKVTLAECEKNAAAMQAALQAQIEDLEKQLADERNTVQTKEMALQAEGKRVKDVEQQLTYFKETNTSLLNRLEDLSIVSKSGAESIRKSLETLDKQNRYIQNLSSSIQRKDSLTLALVMSIKRALSDVNDSDVNVEVKKGVVYISISDKMLFESGSYRINKGAEKVLEKIALILNDHKDLDILVEGHTDNKPISNESTADNWDLSVKRATSVVRTLQTKYKVDPTRMTAGGRSEYLPKADNTTAEGRSVNRRTEIIVLPKLDQFFQMLDASAAK